MKEEWTASGLVADFAATHSMMENRSFAFVLGAGASVTSGIPTGAQLVQIWLRELQVLVSPTADSEDLDSWATAETLDIPGFDPSRHAEFYPHVFLRRFRNDPEQGYAYLEHAMEAAEPSYGYSVLARLLSETRHRVVVSTNFDNLVADAIAIYGSKYPLIAGHESLTGFISSQLRRPLVAKIHRDLFYEPKNDPESVSHLPDSWHNALRKILRSYTPIFIGYGGNDGSLMGFLESLTSADVVGRPRWCYREADGYPNERIQSLVSELGGVLVPIPGFDELMLMLGNAFKYELRHRYVVEKAEHRANLLLSQFERLRSSVTIAIETTELKDSDEVRAPSKAAQETALREDGAIRWYLDIHGAQVGEAKILLARRAIAAHPNDARLLLLGADALLNRAAPSESEVAEGRDYAERALDLSDFPFPEAVRATVLWLYLDNAAAAADAYESAASTNPLDVAEYVNYAETLIVTGRYESARRLLQNLTTESSFIKNRPAIGLVQVILSLIDGKWDSRASGIFHRALLSGSRDERYSVHTFLPHLRDILDDGDFDFVKKLAEVVVEKSSELTELTTYPQWRMVAVNNAGD